MRRTKRRILAMLCVVLAVTVALCAGATAERRTGGYVEAGSWSSAVLSRLNITVTPSDIVIVKNGSGNSVTARISITVSKTEPDFYSKISGFSLDAGDIDYIIAWKAADNSIPITPHSCVLGIGEDGEPKEYTWYADVTLPGDLSGTVPLTMNIVFVTGKTKISASRADFAVPINIFMLDKSSLEDAIEAGKSVQNRENYTDISVLVLDTAVADGEALLANSSGVSSEQFDGAVEDIYTAIESLELKSADYSRIEFLKLSIPERSLYSAASLARLDAVLNSIEYDKNITEQAQVDLWSVELEEAIDALYPAEFYLTPIKGVIVDEQALTVTATQDQSLLISTFLTANFGTVKTSGVGEDRRVIIIYNGKTVKQYSIIIVAE